VACGPSKTARENGKPSAQGSEPSSATLSFASSSVAPGEETKGKIVISLVSGWHTYSDPPGDSGMAPIVLFKIPEGWKATLLPLPKPRTFVDDAGTTFGYEDKLEIGFLLRAPENAVVGQNVKIETDVQWLVCKEICLPQSASLTVGLVVAGAEEKK
jgi:thiol:disulfide interchange protein DsbD